jgi:hypothetical protein
MAKVVLKLGGKSIISNNRRNLWKDLKMENRERAFSENCQTMDLGEMKENCKIEEIFRHCILYDTGVQFVDGNRGNCERSCTRL